MPPAAAPLATLQAAFHEQYAPAHRGRIRVIASDVDGTLTSPAGHLRPITLEVLAELRRLPDPPTLVLVTGRPAAAVQGLLLYTGFGHCPIVAENGAVVLPHPGAQAQVLHPFKAQHEAAVRACLRDADVSAQPAEDNADRHADMTFVPDGAGAHAPEALAALAETMHHVLDTAADAGRVPPVQILHSTVHVHVGPATASKADALTQLLAGAVPGLPDAPVPADACVILGDSANDAALFAAFPERAVAVPGPGPALDPTLATCARYAAPAVADEGFAAVVRALFPPAS